MEVTGELADSSRVDLAGAEFREVSRLIAETLNRHGHKDGRSVAGGLWLLAAGGYPDLGPLLAKYANAVARHADLEYWLVSMWAHALREKPRLGDLANSEREGLRVPALVFLMILDERRYAPALEELSMGDSLTSARACLALAERGRTAGLARLLTVLSKGAGGRRDRRWRIIRQRVDVLFSNATGGKTNGMKPAELLAYWQKHRDRLEVRDPWRAEWDKCFSE